MENDKILLAKREKVFRRQKKFYKTVLPVFKLVSRKLQRDYRAAFPVLLKRVKIDCNTSVLDVGTGTGGLAGLFLEYTSHVTGVDYSPEMLTEAQKKYGHKIDFECIAAHEISHFEAGRFDIVTAAFSLHDMDNNYRQRVLTEMHRVAKEKVIIFDFVKNNGFLIRMIEFLEGSYYRDFLNNIDMQLDEIFPNYERIKCTNIMGLYICEA